MSGNHDDLRKFQDFFEYIFVQQGFRLFYSHANWGGPPDRELPPEPAIEPKSMSARAGFPSMDSLRARAPPLASARLGAPRVA